MELERIASRALSKEASRRYQTAADLIADMSGIDVSSPSQTALRQATSGQKTDSMRSEPRSIRTLAGVGLLTVLLLAAAYWLGKSTIEDPEPPQMLKIALSTAPIQVMSRPAISENARYIAFFGRDSTTSKTGFYLKDLQEGTTRYLEGTESHFWAYFSPDNQRLALTDGRGGSIMTLPDGKLSKFTDYYIADWYSNQELFTQGNDATIITIDGNPTYRFTADSTRDHDGFNYPIRTGNSDKIWLVAINRARSGTDLVLYDMGNDSYSIVLKDGDWNYFWMDSGHIITGKGQSGLEAHVRPFDPQTGEFTGPDFNLGFVLEPTMVGNSKSGHLVRVLGNALYRDSKQLAWLDLDSGNSEILDVPADRYVVPVLSPDGNRIISYRSDENFKAIELTSVDLITGLASDYGSVATYQGPFWPEQSDEFFFVTSDEGGFTIRGSNSLRLEGESNHSLDGFKLGKLFLLDVSEDLTRILASQALENNETEIVVLSVENGEVLHKSKAVLPQLELSPDGKYYAMVVASPTGNRLIVSQVDGNETHVLAETTDRISTPLWKGDGSEIFYHTISSGTNVNRFHRLNVGLQPTFSFHGMDVVGEILGNVRLQDVDSGRNRLLYSKSQRQQATKPVYELEMTLNLSEYFKKVAPPSK